MITTKYLRTCAVLILTLLLVLPVSAQDFGHPKDKEFYKAHWNEIIADLGPDQYIESAQYVLYDFDKDGHAELYLWFGNNEEYLYTNKNNKAVRVSETNKTVDDAFSLDPFYAHFMAPYELLLDKPVNQQMSTEQQVYDRFDIPRIWFKLHPKVEGKFNIRTAIRALCSFDCEFLSPAMEALSTGEYSKDEVEEFVTDVTNGYAKLSFKSYYMNQVEFCYWNLSDGDKLLAMHYHFSGYEDDDPVEWIEQLLFMKYDAKTQTLNPVVAPIEGYDFFGEYNFELPRRGKNITLIGPEYSELVWTGSGFKY